MALSEDDLREIESLSSPAGARVSGPGLQVEQEPAVGQSAFPSGEERMGAIGGGLARGFLETWPVAAGIAGGMKLGAMGGPYAPLTVPLGAIAGGVAGYFAGQEAGSVVPEPEREDLRSWFEGGRTFGSGIGMAPAAFAMPVMRGSKLSTAISNIGEYARRSPVGYLGKEAVASAYAGLAGGMAVEYAPDSPLTRLGAEVTAGIFGPGKFLFDLREGANALRTSAGTALTSADRVAADRVSTFLNRVLTQAGEDPADVIRLLRENETLLFPPGMAVTPTPGMKTGSEGLTALERSLARTNQVYGSERGEQAFNTIAAYRSLIDMLQQTGDPAALTAAAKIREQYYDGLLSQALSDAQTKAAAAATGLKRGETADRATIGQVLKTNIENALTDARTMERELWTAAISDAYKVSPTGRITPIKISPTSTRRTFLEAAAEMTPERLSSGEMSTLVSAMRRYGLNAKALNTFKKGRQTPEYLQTGQVPDSVVNAIPVKPIEAQEMLALRGDLLAAARSAESRGEANIARIFDRVSSSLLQDLEKLPGDGYTAARTFSRQLNDAFTRTFTGTLDDVSKSGAQRYTPETLVQRAFSLGTDMAYERMRDVRQSMRFLSRQYDEAVARFGQDSPQAERLLPYAKAAERRYTSVRAAQVQMMRLGAGEALDRTTGEVNPAMLQRFVDRNRTALRELGLLKEMENAASAQRAFLDVQDTASALNRSVKQEEAFAKLLGTEDPLTAVTSVLNGKKPVQGLRELTKIAATPEAREGLKSVLHQWAMTRAGGFDDRFNARALSDALFKPLSRNQPSLAQSMISNGLMTSAEQANLQKILAPMLRIEDALADGRLLTVVSPNQGLSAVEEVLISQLGAQIAGAISPGGPGSLSFASTVIKNTRNLFSRLPARQAMDLLIKAAKDPELTAALLERNLSPQQDRALALGLLRRMYSFGTVNAATQRYLDEELSEEEQPQEEAPAPPPRRLPPAPPVRGLGTQAPPANPPRPGASGTPGPTGAPGQPSNRELFQRLFPSDTISPLIPPPQPLLPGMPPR